MLSDRLKRATRPLSVRLTFWHSLILLVSALTLLVLTDVLLRKRAAATERDIIEFRLHQYASEYQRGGIAAVQELAARRKGRMQKALFLRIANAENKTLFQRDPDDWSEFHLERLDTLPIPPAGVRTWYTFGSNLRTELQLAVEQLRDGGVVQVGKSNEELLALMRDFRRSAIFVLLVALPLSFAGGSFLASRALRPVGQLTGAAQEIVATSRFDARVPAPGTGDELDALVRVFNEMLGRIDALVRELRDSIENVAHDLRTPLTRLRHIAQSAIEASQAGPAATSPQCEALADCVEEADRVSTMLNTIMDIAEAEAGLVKLHPVALTVAVLVARVVESYSEFAEERGVSVVSQIEPALRIRADEIAISRVFANLLDNAIKYTPPQGRVTISARRNDGRVVICLDDTGAGIAPDDLPRIWERLFRSDRSRTERGLGLGLSFVRAIVQAHGGTAEAESEVRAGTTIRITLPAA